ncbi:MAG: 3-deoxy-manno-octulosonate cytidylyltransferase [Lentimicrobium sp.]|uniref:3-deoxy-manno-octulosonate cytidylyltransferase n=1 Tax=Lentimicrobium sp. TaxID=2034841 RepID=UPI002B21820F|nr:3-deoxy-manno-octulosonate cytidylyltransferase [Lentimicrobium sp.]MEA5109289.1 3-deoxy-manno-octulosonate cytidylyltransferase [Lentimicrobium sp.]
MTAVGVIPARYASTRFPGKPLVMIKGMSMIERVYRQASRCTLLSAVIVATDDARIAGHVAGFGGRVIMTSPHHPSGTDRIAETMRILAGNGEHYDIAVNIQGDEPTIRPEQIESVVSLFSNSETRIATLIKVIKKTEDLFNPNVVKVLTDKSGKALLFSRSPIPHIRQHPDDEWTSVFTFYRHIGIYAYLTQTLQDISGLPPAPPETAESLEQLRWLWNGYSIQTNITDFETIGIDTPEDLSKLTNIA